MYFTTRIHLTRLESDPTRIRDPWTRWSPLPAVRRRCAGRICRWPGIGPAAAHRVRRLPSRGRGDGTACRGLPRDASRVAECRAQALLALPKASTQCRRDLRPVCAHLARDLPRTRAEAVTSARISRAAWTRTAEVCCQLPRTPARPARASERAAEDKLPRRSRAPWAAECLRAPCARDYPLPKDAKHPRARPSAALQTFRDCRRAPCHA